MKKQFILLLFAVLLFTACDEQKKFEKIVIIDSIPTTKFDILHRYKVKRIDHGVITYIYMSELYEIGDTLLYPFINTPNQLQTRSKK